MRRRASAHTANHEYKESGLFFEAALFLIAAFYAQPKYPFSAM